MSAFSEQNINIIKHDIDYDGLIFFLHKFQFNQEYIKNIIEKLKFES